MIIKFYNEEELQTIIKADFKTKTIEIENIGTDVVYLAFGVKQNPTWEDFESFLENRCPSRQRANLKEVLRDIGVQYYDPVQICKKTNGRCAEDDAWMEFVEDKELEEEQELE